MTCVRYPMLCMYSYKSTDHAVSCWLILSFAVESSCVAILAEELVEASPDWNFIGIHLGLRKADLPQEDAADVNECFMKMLDYSLKNYPKYPLTRRIVFEAVKCIDPSLALKLKEEYDNDEKCEYNWRAER